jgi:hypothetical protein
MLGFVIRSRSRLLLATFQALLCAERIASAEVTVFTNRAEWEAAAGSFITEPFNNVPGTNLNFLSLGQNNVGLLDIEIAGDLVRNNYLWSQHGSRYFGEIYRGSPTHVTNPSLVFRSPVSAFGADWGGPQNVKLAIGPSTVVLVDLQT